MPLCPQIVITPITVTTTGMTTTSIIPIVAATTEEIDELQVEIDTIEVSVNGKNHIYRQATAPDGSVYPLTEGDVWFDTDDGNKQYYWTGSAWVSVQDLGIAAAEAGAAAAAAAAAAASAAAASATSAAAAAASAATAAQTTADGKNKVYRQATAPTGTHAIGDLWFDSSADNKPNRWTGSAWEAYGFGNLAVGNLDASAISTGTLNADRIAAASITGAKIVGGTIEAVNIAAGTITGAKLAVGTIEAVSIAAGTITGTKIAAGTITASNIATATITADQIAGGAITADEIAANTITALEIEAGSITVDRLAVGTLTAFTLQTSSGSRRVRIDATNNAISFREAGTIVGWVGPASVSGVLMHYGSTFNANATTYPLAYVSSGSALMAYSSTKFLEVNSLGVVATGNFYSATQTYIQDSSTSANAVNARIDVGDGRLRRSTASSIRFKEAIVDISTVADLDPTKLLYLPIRAFKFKSDYLDETDNRSGMLVPGFIAEEVAEHYPVAADLGADGLVENWNERFVIPGMLALIQDLHARINTLEGNANG
jgi:hypothetical protein